ncbi:hypothetical protein DL95DRAFT_395814 [Leptodontidium sp. 2 PMI_412]|nr:hypothetical protein DL95DRAFT_395814 [Leptodontidium sp. 2 PMI_412]
MMGPDDEDPRIRGDDIPKFLYRVEPRLSEKSPTSPSIDGFKATTSGMYRTAASRDAFPTTRQDYELFLGEYCDLMNNPIHHDTSTHLHFVGFYTTRSLAEREAALMRTNGLTYRVYCVRGECLTQFVSSVVKGRSVLTIGRSTNAEIIHTDPQVGEEFLVWGRVPPEALVGSWGADGMLQYASGRSSLFCIRVCRPFQT